MDLVEKDPDVSAYVQSLLENHDHEVRKWKLRARRFEAELRASRADETETATDATLESTATNATLESIAVARIAPRFQKAM